MLLFTTSTVDPTGWKASNSFRTDGLIIEAAIDRGRHAVVVRLEDTNDAALEIVGPSAAVPEGRPVSSVHLPPYYRWESGAFSCRFSAEWREGAASLASSLRHVGSLASHPRALVVDRSEPLGAIVVGTPKPVVHPETGHPTVGVDWRGWHVVDVDDPFEGPSQRVLATHTEVFRA